MGEAFRVPGDPHKRADKTWPVRSSLYRLEPPYVDQEGIHTHAIVASLKYPDGPGAVAVGANEKGSVAKFHALGYQEGSDIHDSLLKELGYPDIYDQEQGP